MMTAARGWVVAGARSNMVRPSGSGTKPLTARHDVVVAIELVVVEVADRLPIPED
jgi:hypothetical protein